MTSSYNPHQQEDVALQEIESPVYKLILHNDDFHTFDFVIEALVESCGHSVEQAEQCAFIVHFNGQCDVKRGSMKVVKKPYHFLAEKGLLVTIA